MVFVINLLCAVVSGHGPAVVLLFLMNQISENEVTNHEQNFPKCFLQLYSVAKIKSAFDGLTLLLHSILLDVGFIPKDIAEDDAYKCMPANWNSSGLFRIQYYHKNIPEAFCWVTCVPMFKNLTVQGTFVNEPSDDNNVHTKLLVADYVIAKGDFSYPSKLFIHVKELTRIFKDEFCFALLVLMQQSVTDKPAFGLNGLIDDVKKSVLKLLPVEAVVSLSGVNKHFHHAANSLDLWKFMYQRDFGSVPTLTSAIEENWKELYKSEYLKRKRPQRENRPQPIMSGGLIHPSHYFPQIYPTSPNFGFDPRINMDPALQMVFPQMRSRFQRSDWPFEWNNGYHHFGRFW